MRSTTLAGTHDALAGLRKQAAAAALAGFVILGSLGATEPSFVALGLPVWAACMALLLGGLTEAREMEGALPARLGWPTVLTLLRGLLIAVLAGSASISAWLGASAYSAAALLDHADGRLARRLGRTTRLGAKLDQEFDALGILVATCVAIHLGKVPAVYLAVGLARYLFVAGAWLRRRRGRRVHELDPSRLRRILAGCQMGFLAVALWPPLPSELTHAASLLFGSGTVAMFVRDWRHVTRESP